MVWMGTRFRPTLFALILAVMALSGCGRDAKIEAVQGATFRWASFPISVQLDSALYNDPNARADLVDAIRFWENEAGKPLFQLAGEYTSPQAPFTGSASDPDEISSNVILFQSPWPFASDVAGQSILHAEQNITQHAIMLLNPNTQLCNGDCNGQPSATSQRKLFAHELGHFLGFNHTSDSKDIMFPTIQTGGSLNGVEINMGILKQLVN